MQTDLLKTCKMSQDRVLLCQLRNRLVLTSGNSEKNGRKCHVGQIHLGKKKTTERKGLIEKRSSQYQFRQQYLHTLLSKI